MMSQLLDNTPLLGLPNIGPTIAGRLATVGIQTVGDLRAVGVPTAYQQLRMHHVGITLTLCYYLYSLQGALDGIHWDALSPATKADLCAAAGVKMP